MTNQHPIATRTEWLAARKTLLAEEREFTHLRDRLSEKRRALPWVKVDKRYVFQTGSDQGTREATLADLFEGRSQLVVYHFMFAPESEAGCKACSFWADSFNGIHEHLKHRDVTFAAISRAPLAKLQTFAKRFGWTFTWVSSHGSDFNYDYGVSFRPEAIASGEATYNFGSMKPPGQDMPGASAFIREGDTVFHTYSTYGRGIDAMNAAYQYLDIAPKGRDEAGLSFSMEWLKLRDQYTR